MKLRRIALGRIARLAKNGGPEKAEDHASQGQENIPAETAGIPEGIPDPETGSVGAAGQVGAVGQAAPAVAQEDKTVIRFGILNYV